MRNGGFGSALVAWSALAFPQLASAAAMQQGDRAMSTAEAPPVHSAAEAASPQTSTGGEIASPSPPEDSGVGEIVVTARKRVERLRDVPVSVQALSGTQLASAKITQLVDLVSRAPTLNVSYGTADPFVEIRGFGTGNSLSFDQAVGKFVDNVSYGRDQDARLPLFDLERVEVLNGPQVLLYGNSSTAGALNLTTRKPGDRFEADGSVAYEFNSREVVTQGGMTVPLASGASLRVAGIYQDLARGWVDDVSTGQRVPQTRNYAVRGILKLDPSSTFDVLLKAEYDHLRDRGNSAEPIAQPTAGPPVFPEVLLDNRNEINDDVAPFFQKPYNSYNNQTYQADLNLQGLGGAFTSTTAYRRLDYAGSTPGGFSTPVFNGWIAYGYKQFSEELRYSGRFGRFDLTVGGFYQHEKIDVVEALDTNLAALGAPLPAFAFNFLFSQKTNTYSGFGDVTFHFTSRLSLEVGGRYSDTRKTASQAAFPGDIVPNKRFGMGLDATSTNAAFFPLFTGFFGVAPHAFDDLRYGKSYFQPQVVGQYKFSPNAQLYAKYVKGDKAGGFDANYQGVPGNFGPDGARFAPEQAEGFEVGVKGLTLGRRLDYALDAFTTTFTNLQTNAFRGAATVAVVTNVGRARTRGFEGQINYAPLVGLRISLNAAYTDARYLDFPGAVCTRAQTAAQPMGCQQDLSGTRTPFASRLSGTGGVDYEVPAGGYMVGGGFLLIGRTGYNASVNNEPLQNQQGYVQVDVHLDLKPRDGRWSLSLFGRDLSDRQFLEYGSAVPLTTGGLVDFRSRGRQLGLKAGFQF